MTTRYYISELEDIMCLVRLKILVHYAVIDTPSLNTLTTKVVTQMEKCETSNIVSYQSMLLENEVKH